jgi:hypothetical protein
MNPLRLALFSSLILLASPLSTRACDLCSAFAATEAEGLSSSGWNLSLATQFTHFATLRLDGDKVPNDFAQHLDSTITQLVISRAFTSRFAAQLNVPFIVRTFRRPEGFALDEGRESGFGDVSLLGRMLVLRRDTADATVVWSALAGVKFPTGNTRRIAEELSETDESGASESGIHGHDLTLGTGSTDAIVGTNFYFRHARFFATGSVQYTLRSRGDYDYRFANDLAWELAPGAYLALEHTRTFGLQAVLSGEHKGTDTFQGSSADDTGITSIYVGPRLTYTQTTRLSAALGADFPIRMDNTALQLTPDYRLRVNFTWNF